MELANFTVRKLDNAHGDLDLAKGKLASPEFISSDDIWIAAFDIEGIRHEAAIRRGRRTDVAEDTDQIDIQLRVSEQEFDSDTFIPESRVAEITAAVGDEFIRRGLWDERTADRT